MVKTNARDRRSRRENGQPFNELKDHREKVCAFVESESSKTEGDVARELAAIRAALEIIAACLLHHRECATGESFGPVG